MIASGAGLWLKMMPSDMKGDIVLSQIIIVMAAGFLIPSRLISRVSGSLISSEGLTRQK